MAIEARELREQTGADGVMHLNIPTGQPDRAYRVIVLLEPESAGEQSSGQPNGWPAGFLDELVGSWTAEVAEESEGDYEQRDAF
jgi:hypothetical protein